MVKFSNLILFSVALGVGLAEEGQQLQNKILVCYWGTWSHYRNTTGEFRVAQIPPSLCTHIVYSFFGLDQDTNTAVSLDPWLDYSSEDGGGGGLDMIRKTVALREQSENLKITLAIGGWNEGSLKYSNMAKTQATRSSFISSIINILRKYDLDGIDIDWEYPARRDGLPEDRENFVLLLKELRESLDAVIRPPPRGPLLLTAAFGCYEKFLDVSYDLPNIAKYLDYLHLMLYDFKMFLYDDGSGEVEPGSNLIGHHSPLFSKHWEDLGNQTMTTSFAVESFIQKGVDPSKIVFGIGTYGKTYELFSRARHNFYDEAVGPGARSNSTLTAGTSAMFEICLELSDPETEWEMGFDNDYKVPYVYSDTKWIGYDDTLSARLKTDYAMNKGLAGMMVWSLDFDDFANYCQGWTNFPIINALRERLLYYDRK